MDKKQMKENKNALFEEIKKPAEGRYMAGYYKYLGYREHFGDRNRLARAYAFKSLLENTGKHVYGGDLIAGSMRGIFDAGNDISQAEFDYGNGVSAGFGDRSFLTNADHAAPNYARLLKDGIPGILERIDAALERFEEESESADAARKEYIGGRLETLRAMKIAAEAYKSFILDYAKACDEKGESECAETLRSIAVRRPETFREALQLIWLTHVVFCLEGRYAMALGRLDKILYPFYRKDIESGLLDREGAKELVISALYKIRERRALFGGDDVVNIVIGGVNADGSGGVNGLSYVILDAVGTMQIPGPNLSMRYYEGIPDDFLDGCLKVVGTGLGYPAMMNDAVNIPALLRHGYAYGDVCDYCMVGCIENFIQGKQPPWSDGRFNTPKYLELALGNGRCMLSGVQKGPETGDPCEFKSMDDVMNALEAQMRYGAAQYIAGFKNVNESCNPEHYNQPFLSLFFDDCIERGLDINEGGAVYPSVHGAGLMGVGTMADSLAAIETVVFRDKKYTMETLVKALKADFEGYGELQAELLAAPKYGNDDETADKYARWFVSFQDRIFSEYKTRDGGAIYIIIASNVSNIPAGLEVAATPDGRKAKMPLSDAASPTHGRDRRGPAASLRSLSKPDYSCVSCGSVINQKYSPSMFSTPENIAKMRELVKYYFSRGGQEIQINSVSRDVLKDAIEHPEDYSDLVVRVSGFSAYYNSLDKAVKLDILARTEHA